MDYSIQSTMLSSMGGRGSVLLTGGQTASNPNGFIAFRSVDANITIAGITGTQVSGISYLNGKTLTHPAEFLGPFSDIAIGTGSAGAVQLYY